MGTKVLRQESYLDGKFFLKTNVKAEVLHAAERVIMSVKDVYIRLAPMFHVHAWGVLYAATLLGVKQVYPGRCVMNSEVVDAISGNDRILRFFWFRV